ncbi:MAG: hypothetical protein IID41_15715 [Planctomycetes bacterium]|nr:hypothetical protein [Planctomycetota bacterium]
MSLSTGRKDALILAHDWLTRALGGLRVVESAFFELAYQAYTFLLMGYDTSELVVWRDKRNRAEVVPMSMVTDA